MTFLQGPLCTPRRVQGLRRACRCQGSAAVTGAHGPAPRAESAPPHGRVPTPRSARWEGFSGDPSPGHGFRLTLELREEARGAWASVGQGEGGAQDWWARRRDKKQVPEDHRTPKKARMDSATVTTEGFRHKTLRDFATGQKGALLPRGPDCPAPRREGTMNSARAHDKERRKSGRRLGRGHRQGFQLTQSNCPLGNPEPGSRPRCPVLSSMAPYAS